MLAAACAAQEAVVVVQMRLLRTVRLSALHLVRQRIPLHHLPPLQAAPLTAAALWT